MEHFHSHACKKENVRTVLADTIVSLFYVLTAYKFSHSMAKRVLLYYLRFSYPYFLSLNGLLSIKTRI
ncbi:Uncharacterized protein HZ326_3702 [Fusarium oxysporum f. sp. albedinis]|nr:Uncharacterized protein HZ326_3702 [Fusarium oxysporum f. sp. albedinis]